MMFSRPGSTLAVESTPREEIATPRELPAVLVPLGDLSAFRSQKVFIARCPCRIVDCGLLVDKTLARHASNYWEAVFRRRSFGPYDTAYATAVKAATPLRYYKLDELSGTAAADAMGGSAGTHTGGVTVGAEGAPGTGRDPADSTGSGETAATYDGTNDYTDLGSQTLAWGNVLTMRAWVKPNALATAQTIIGNEDASSSPRLAIDAAGKVIVAIGATIVVQETSSLLRAGVWNHILYTRSATGTGGHRLTINGMVATFTTAAGNYADEAATWTLGRRAAGSEWFAGSIDEVALYASVVAPDTARDEAGVIAWKNSQDATFPADIGAEGFTEGRKWSMLPARREVNTLLNEGDQVVCELQPFGAPAALKSATAYVYAEPA